MHSRFRNGIFVLAIVLFVGLFLLSITPNFDTEDKFFLKLPAIQAQIDSLKNVQKAKKKAFVIKPFNPNFITDYKGYVLGLSKEELNRLRTYRAKDQWINSTNDFQKITQVSDSMINTLRPLFKFPEWVSDQNKKKKEQYNQVRKLSFEEKKDLNQVSSEVLQQEIGVPDFIADRIIRYRNKINGFVHESQLKDIKGLYDQQRNKIIHLYAVKSGVKRQKINVNKATVKELLEVPYFDFEMALDINDYVKEHHKVKSLEELRNVEGFPWEKIERIALYLTLN